MAKKSSTSKKKQPAARAGRSAGSKPAAKPSATSKRSAKKSTTKKSTAKKSTAKKSTAKKTSARSASSTRSSKSKATTRSAQARPKKKVSKKVAKKRTKKVTRKVTRAPAKKAGQKKAATRKAAGSRPASRAGSTKKSSAKKAPTKKTTAKKSTAKKTSTKKSTAKKTSSKKSSTKKSTAKKPAQASNSKSTKPASGAKASTKAGDKPSRKGITIVSKQPERRSWPKRPPPPVPRIGTGGMPSLGSVFSKPLIPSGPATVAKGPKADAKSGKKPRCPYTKRQLEKFRKILIAKRTELIEGVADLEHEALKGTSGSLSNLPQHMAEQGSEAAEQTLSLNLAAAERRLITDIDAALARIADRTYGLCELTGKPINPERLEELPWTRYSIEAARELERRSYGS